jgi:hypothetical protein
LWYIYSIGKEKDTTKKEHKMKVFYGRKEGKIAYDTTDAGMQVWSTLEVGDDQDIADVLDYLRTVSGKPIASMPGFSWSYDETYRTQAGRDTMRAALLAPAKVVEAVKSAPMPSFFTTDADESFMLDRTGA